MALTDVISALASRVATEFKTQRATVASAIQGPTSSTVNAVPRYTNTLGRKAKDSLLLITDLGAAKLTADASATGNLLEVLQASTSLFSVTASGAAVGANAVWHAGNFSPASKADLVGGLIPESQIPAVAITDVFEVATQAEMLALTTQRGDVAVRSDLNKSYILRALPATALSNWTELRTPTDAVLSVAGKTGAVSLAKADVGLGSVDNTADASKPVSTAQQSALDAKLNSSAYNAADVLAKLLTVDTDTAGINASTLRGTTPGTTGASVLAAATQAAARTAIGADPALGFTPVQQGGGAGQGTSKIYLGWASSFPKMQVDSTDIGRVWTDVEGARSLGSVGYQKLPGGLILQWGKNAVGDGASITFPVAFPTASCAIIPSASYSSAGTAETTTVFVSASTANAFTVRTRFVNNGGAVGVTAGYIVHWIAIGY